MRKGLVISGCAIARRGITLFSMNSPFFPKQIFNAISFNRRICKWLDLTFSLHTHFSETRLIQFAIRTFVARYKKTLRNIRKEKTEMCYRLCEKNDGCYWVAWQLLMRIWFGLITNYGLWSFMPRFTETHQHSCRQLTFQNVRLVVEKVCAQLKVVLLNSISQGKKVMLGSICYSEE